MNGRVGFVVKECEKLVGKWSLVVCGRVLENCARIRCAFIPFPSLLPSQFDPSRYRLPFDVGARRQLFL